LEYISNAVTEDQTNDYLVNILDSLLTYVDAMDANEVNSPLYTRVMVNAISTQLAKPIPWFEKDVLPTIDMLASEMDLIDHLPELLRETKTQIILKYLRTEPPDMMSFVESIHDVLNEATDKDLITQFEASTKKLNNKATAATEMKFLLNLYNLNDFKKTMSTFLEEVINSFSPPFLSSVLEDTDNGMFRPTGTFISFSEMEECIGSSDKLKAIYNREDKDVLNYLKKIRSKEIPPSKKREREEEVEDDDDILWSPEMRKTHQKPKIAEPSMTITTEIIEQKGKGKQRRKWSTEEEEMLIQGLLEIGRGKWAEMVKRYGFERSAPDLKDKWRNMKKHKNLNKLVAKYAKDGKTLPKWILEEIEES